ncbi:Beclin-1 [Sparganum proliferum]
MSEVEERHRHGSGSQKVSVGQYSCQKCKNPIYLTADLEQLRGPDLSSIIGEEISICGSFSPDQQTSPSLTMRRPTPQDGYKQPSLFRSSHPSTSASSMDHRLQVNAYLFDILSGRVKPNHPMCQECADILIHTQKQLLDFQLDELSCLQAYLSQLNAKSVSSPASEDQRTAGVTAGSPTAIFSDQGRVFFPSESSCAGFAGPSPSAVPEEISPDVPNESSCSSFARYHSPDTPNTPAKTPSLPSIDPPVLRCSIGNSDLDLSPEEAELASLQEELARVLSESKLLDEQIERDSAELQRRQEELDLATSEYNENKLILLEAEESLGVLEARLRDARYQFERLRRTNVLNAAFPIWYDGHIGMINGLHLGRLPNKPIEWSEINAAWGQCALLLQCLAKKLSHTFTAYSILPLGNQSQIIQLATDRAFPLYNSPGSIRLFNAGKFDTAMTMFLECVNQLQEIVERPPKFELPYKILDKGRMRDTDNQIYSIRLTGSSEENWTKCLKMLLINLKWIIASTVVPR